MDQVKVIVTVEDETGVFFRQQLQFPREQLIAPGMATPGMGPISEALYKASREVQPWHGQLQ